MKGVTRGKTQENFRRFVWAKVFGFAYDFEATADQIERLYSERNKKQNKETTYTIKTLTSYTFDKGLALGLQEELKQLNSKT